MAAIQTVPMVGFRCRILVTRARIPWLTRDRLKLRLNSQLNKIEDQTGMRQIIMVCGNGDGPLRFKRAAPSSPLNEHNTEHFREMRRWSKFRLQSGCWRQLRGGIAPQLACHPSPACLHFSAHTRQVADSGVPNIPPGHLGLWTAFQVEVCPLASCIAQT